MPAAFSPLPPSSAAPDPHHMAHNAGKRLLLVRHAECEMNLLLAQKVRRSPSCDHPRAKDAHAGRSTHACACVTHISAAGAIVARPAMHTNQLPGWGAFQRVPIDGQGPAAGRCAGPALCRGCQASGAGAGALVRVDGRAGQRHCGTCPPRHAGEPRGVWCCRFVACRAPHAAQHVTDAWGSHSRVDMHAAATFGLPSCSSHACRLPQ